VRRLFSTFAHGAPGVGLILLRLASGLALISDALTSLRGHPPLGPPAFDVFISAIGILLVIGLWTPIAGTLLALIGLCHAFVEPTNRSTYVLLGMLGAALTLIGPGRWSVDARLFGWKRINTRDRVS
jgi:putative oxidoreductase